MEPTIAAELTFVVVDAQRRSYARASRSLRGRWPEDGLLDATAIATRQTIATGTSRCGSRGP